MKIFLSGGSGLVGSSLVNHFSQLNYEVFAPPSSVLNLKNYDQTFDYINEIKPDLVIHCAGKVGGIQANILNQLEFFTENMQIGKNLILASKNNGVKQLLNLASSCVYPSDKSIHLEESMILEAPLEKTNEGYALAKICCLKMCQYISESTSLQYKTVVPCNIYGRNDSYDHNKSHLVPAIIRKIHEAKENKSNSVEIWGDGTARREFMFSQDLAECISHCIQNFNKMPVIMNVGVDNDYSISEYYQIVANVIGFKGTFTYDRTKPVGMSRKKVCTLKQRNFGWKPRFSIDEGVRLTYLDYLEALDS